MQIHLASTPTEKILNEMAQSVDDFSEGNAVVDTRSARTVARRQWRVFGNDRSGAENGV